MPVGIHDVEHVQRLAIHAVFAHVIEDLLHRPLILHRDELRRHQSAHAAFGIIEERLRDFQFFGAEKTKQLRHRRAGQFLDERRAVVGRHRVENMNGVLLPHGVQQVPLRWMREIGERGGCNFSWQQAEDDDLLFRGQVLNQLRDVRRWPLGENFLEFSKTPLPHEFLYFRSEQLSKHKWHHLQRGEALQR